MCSTYMNLYPTLLQTADLERLSFNGSPFSEIQEGPVLSILQDSKHRQSGTCWVDI